MTPKDLLEIIRTTQLDDRLDVDTSTVRYALYARKSTKGDEKQERSIPDQIKECIEKVMTPNNINPIQVVEEKWSAKEPDVRVKFKQLINDIKTGKVNGLIAWHPDRLARNMKEAGEIIDLLDKGVLKDLRFATFTFENNPTGKMLLGISFVLSKQYSEHLSESVNRGNKHATENDGQFIGKFKHGYYVNTETKHLISDNETYTKIKRMFEMRLDGRSQKEIREWINSQGYKLRKAGKDPVDFTWSKDDVSNLFRDPVYTGILVYGKSSVNLLEKYDFQPMISTNDYMKLNKLDSFDPSKVSSAIRAKREDTRANLLRGLVHCGACNKPFTSMVIDKRDNAGAIKASYYYYKCETKGCAMKNKGIRAKEVLQVAQDFFEQHLFTTRSNYDNYVEHARLEVKAMNQNLDSDIASLKSRISVINNKYQTTKDLLSTNPALAEHYDLSSIRGEEDKLRFELSNVYHNVLARKTR